MNSKFVDFIHALGYEGKLDLIAGKFIRFGHKNSVSAKLFDDGLGGVVHDWRTGEKHYWFANNGIVSPAEYQKHMQESESLKSTHDAKRILDYKKTSKKAKELFTTASIASSTHPYLLRKKVKAYGIKSLDGKLIIPVYSVLGDFQSIQFIDADGRKKFLKGGQTQGGCHFIGEIRKNKPIYICEGYATAASVYEDTQSLTIVAFNAGNLIKVATELRKQLSEIQIVIAGDADSVGREYAEKASKAVNGSILIPDFGQNPLGFTDWNDYFTRGVTA